MLRVVYHSAYCLIMLGSIVKEGFQQIWEMYAFSPQMQKGSDTQTGKYFNRIPRPLGDDFNRSPRQIIQIGCSSGLYLQELSSKNPEIGLGRHRSVIGYDYSKAGLQLLSTNGFTAREVDLSSITPDGELAYQDALATDLSVASDILMIRVLEYLDPKAVVLMLFFIIQHLKPGSRVDIELYDSVNGEDLRQAGVVHAIPVRYVASFFAPRTDMETVYHSVTANEPEDGPFQGGNTVERLIVQKRFL